MRALTVLALALLSACGFRLAGRVQLPATLAVAEVRTDANPQSDFYRSLRARLVDAGTRLTDATGEGTPIIRVLADSYREDVLTVSARNVPTAYELRYAVRISVVSGGVEWLAPESFELSRDYSFDQTALLAKERERDMLLAALADELVVVVMQRLASL